MNYVSSDIHGSERRYQKLISSINEDDHLYVLGDVIDRGTGGIKILKDMMTRDNVTLLLGNHELLMLNYLIHKNQNKDLYHVSKDEYRKVYKIWIEYNEGAGTLEDYYDEPQSVRKKIYSYLYNSLVWKQIETNGKKYFLVHAMVPKIIDSDEKKFYQMWNQKDYEILYKCLEKRITDIKFKSNNKYYDRIKKLSDQDISLVIGHTPTNKIDSNTKTILHKENIFAIDCGTSYMFGGSLGRLNLDTLEEKYFR